MIEKPLECLGCPLYQSGRGFVPDEMHEDAPITLIAQNPGEQEELEGRPLVGRSGTLCVNSIGKYGYDRQKLNLMNVLKCRWNGGNELPPQPVRQQAIEHCTKAYLYPELAKVKSNVVALLGDVALETLVPNKEGIEEGIDKWRGSYWVEEHGPLKGKKVIATIHPAAIFRKLRYRTASRSDFARTAREASKASMVVSYQDHFRTAVTPQEFLATLEALSAEKKRIALDVETDKEKPFDATLYVIGIAWSKQDAMNVRWKECQGFSAEILQAVQEYQGEIITATPFDASVLYLAGVDPFPWDKLQCVTLLHSRFDIELSHDMEFIASMWTDRPYWKWMKYTDLMTYNLLDCVAEYEAFTRLYNFCSLREPKVIEVYKRDVKLYRAAVKLHVNGLPQDQAVFEKEKEFYISHREVLKESIIKDFEAARVPPVDPGMCEVHPRYSGKTPLKARKGEEELCTHCQKVRRYVVDTEPLKLTRRTQLMNRLEEQGIKIPTQRDRETGEVKKTIAKGAVAEILRKEANHPLSKAIARFAEFKEMDTVVTRYFNESRVSSDGRVHSNYSLHAAMHRWSGTEPNPQQFKKPEDEEEFTSEVIPSLEM